MNNRHNTLVRDKGSTGGRIARINHGDFYRQLGEQVVHRHEGVHQGQHALLLLLRLGPAVAGVQPEGREVDVVGVQAPGAVEAVAEGVADV